VYYNKCFSECQEESLILSPLYHVFGKLGVPRVDIPAGEAEIALFRTDEAGDGFTAVPALDEFDVFHNVYYNRCLSECQEEKEKTSNACLAPSKQQRLPLFFMDTLYHGWEQIASTK
jgi:hypothetical protein